MGDRTEIEDSMETETGRDLSRALDEGIVISGEVEVKLLGLKVLPIKVNLVIGSTGLAESLGLSWWAGRITNNRGPKRSGGQGSRGSTTRRNETSTRGRGGNGQA